MVHPALLAIVRRGAGPSFAGRLRWASSDTCGVAAAGKARSLYTDRMDSAAQIDRSRSAPVIEAMRCRSRQIVAITSPAGQDACAGPQRASIVRV